MTTYSETTDAPQTTATPYTLHAGDEFRGTASVGEGDWLKLSLTGATTCTFGAVGVGAVKSVRSIRCSQIRGDEHRTGAAPGRWFGGGQQ